MNTLKEADKTQERKLKEQEDIAAKKNDEGDRCIRKPRA